VACSLMWSGLAVTVGQAWDNFKTQLSGRAIWRGWLQIWRRTPPMMYT